MDLVHGLAVARMKFVKQSLRKNIARRELIQKEKSKFEKYSYFTKEEQHDQETIVPLLYLICC